MEYLSRLRDTIIQTYEFLQDAVNFVLYREELAFAYSGADSVNVRGFSKGSLENVLFMGSRRVNGHGAKQKGDWVDRKTGVAVKVTSGQRLTRRQKNRMKRVHKNKYQQYSHADEVAREEENRREVILQREREEAPRSLRGW